MALQLASVFDFSIEEKAEERADRCDRRKTPQFVPSWLKRSVDDVRRHLKREPGHQPTREYQPDGAAILVRRTTLHREARNAGEGLDSTGRNHRDRDHLDTQG